MRLSKIEQKVLLEMYNICEYTLIEDISITLLYKKFKDKRYLWSSIRNLESKKILTSHIEKGNKYISLTTRGEKITKALRIIEIQTRDT